MPFKEIMRVITKLHFLCKFACLFTVNSKVTLDYIFTFCCWHPAKHFEGTKITKKWSSEGYVFLSKSIASNYVVATVINPPSNSPESVFFCSLRTFICSARISFLARWISFLFASRTMILLLHFSAVHLGASTSIILWISCESPLVLGGVRRIAKCNISPPTSQPACEGEWDIAIIAFRHHTGTPCGRQTTIWAAHIHSLREKIRPGRYNHYFAYS